MRFLFVLAALAAFCGDAVACPFQRVAAHHQARVQARQGIHSVTTTRTTVRAPAPVLVVPVAPAAKAPCGPGGCPLKK